MSSPYPRAGMSAAYRVGADIGGTFTDVVLAADDGRVGVRKVSTTPDDFGRAILEGLRLLLEEMGLGAAGAREVVHGTTIATNAILEHRGARTGLLTTRGFRDALEIGRLRYPRLYDLIWSKPVPLVGRRWRREVAERLDAVGEVVAPLDEAGAREAIEFLLGEGVESIAVSLLHSYANDAHERRLGELVRELAPGLPLSLSCEVLPEIGEYERASTTAINAYIQPVVGRYLAALDEGLAALGARAPVLVMQSNGGVMSARAAGERPIHIIESGPAAGVIAAQGLARRRGVGDLLTLDMGGTTAKAAIVEGGRLHLASEYEVGAGLNIGNRLNRGAGYPLRVPAIDIAEVGAGGGSQIWLDAAGVVHVGPRSSGAVPGPVCYARGGEVPTLTDANLLLGYLNPDALLSGALPIDRGLAEGVFIARVAAPLGLGAREAAHGVYRIAVASMVRVVRAVSSERGRDPRGYDLVAFGGNGPVHAALVAAELGIPRVVVPPRPGLFSAFGLLVAELSQHFSRTILKATTALEAARLERAFAELEALATGALGAEGYAPDEVILARTVDLRYVGQSFELRLPVAGAIDEAALRALERRFGDEHERTYGHRADADPIEVVHARVVATPRRPIGGSADGRDGVAAGGPREVRLPGRGSATDGGRRRPAYFGAGHGLVETPAVDRADLGATPRAGPLIVEEYDATTVVPPGWRVHRDEWDNLILEPTADPRAGSPSVTE